MSGRRSHAFHEGDRSEYLLTFFLSSIATVTPVPRQEDYGLDFICALTRKEGPSLYVEKEFAVQAKSVSEKYVVYGGLSSKGEWKKWEVEWLFRQTHPLFIASIDRNKWKVKLFATARMWYIRYRFGLPFKIRFLLKESPTTRTAERFLNNIVEKSTSEMGDRKCWTIPLGKPIVEIDVQRLEDPDFRKEICGCIDKWIDLERKNIQNRLLGVPTSFEFNKWDTNIIPMGCLLTMQSKDNVKCYPFYNPTPGWHIEQALAAMTAPALSLALNSASQGKSEELESVKPLLEFLTKRAFLDSKTLNYVMKLIGKAHIETG
jgi:hypothetical protein